MNLIGGKTKKNLIAHRRSRARKLRAKGWSFQKIGDKLGVSQVQAWSYVMGKYSGKARRTKESWAKYCREYRKKNSEKIREYKRLYIKKYREKFGMKRDNARSKVSDAIKLGKLVRGTCVCGSLKTEAHHDDYDKPLEVIWLCRKHHIELHKKA